MEKELKISELAALWNTSVPTTWNRVRKEGLTTLLKKDENNKEVNYVRVSDDIINQYINNTVNNNFNSNNNGYYEDMLNNNNVNKDDKNIIDVEYVMKKPDIFNEFTTALTTYNNGFNEQLTTIHKHYNDVIINLQKEYNEELKTVNNDYQAEIKKLNEELNSYKQKELLIEDKATKEEEYKTEIGSLKNDNKGLATYNERLKNVLIISIMLILGFLLYFINLNKAPVKQVEEPKHEQIQAAPVQAPQPQPIKPQPVKKR